MRARRRIGSGELFGKLMHLNRNKRSLVLDIKVERGRDTYRLLATMSSLPLCGRRRRSGWNWGPKHSGRATST
jgi:hypothetical protein